MAREQDVGDGASEDGEQEDFASLLEDYGFAGSELAVGDRVDATVLSVGQEYVFLDVGTRSEGMLALEEVRDPEGQVRLRVDDRIKVFIAAFREGAPMCTLRVGSAATQDLHGGKEAALAALVEAQASQVPVEGTVKEVVKGGLSVALMGVRAFCPISQIEQGYCEDPALHVGHSYAFAVTQVDARGRNVVVSRRRLLEREAEVRARDLWERISENAVYDGQVVSLQKYGAFVDIGGVQGLLHVSEISHERVEDPGQYLKLGDRVQVMVKRVDRRDRKISLSLRALQDDPWLLAAQELTEGQLVDGVVTRLTAFGAFVELRKGVEGMIHISEMGQERRINSPREVLSQGQRVKVRVLAVDAERHRIGLALEAGAVGASEAIGPDAAAAPSSPTQASLGTFGDLFSKQLKR